MNKQDQLTGLWSGMPGGEVRYSIMITEFCTTFTQKVVLKHQMGRKEIWNSDRRKVTELFKF